jgi:hypothetical protein
MQLNCTEFLNEASEKIDMFGTKVGVNFKRRSTVTTKLGALVTLITIGLGVGYFYTLVLRLLHKDDPKIN